MAADGKEQQHPKLLHSPPGLYGDSLLDKVPPLGGHSPMSA